MAVDLEMGDMNIVDSASAANMGCCRIVQSEICEAGNR